jgi:hypothetical protein
MPRDTSEDDHPSKAWERGPGGCWRTALRFYRHVDVVRDRRGRLRSWEGHLRALARAERMPLRKIRDLLERG